MGTAPYFERTKIAVAQVVAGFDVDAFTAVIEQTSVGVSFGEDVVRSAQGAACADLLVRLCARLYPRLAILTTQATGETGALAHAVANLTNLAVAINPNITISDTATTVVHIGNAPLSFASCDTTDSTIGPEPAESPLVIYVGCDDWTGQLSMEHAHPVGAGAVPIGAGIAACLAASALFRILFDPTAPRPDRAALTALPNPPSNPSFTLPDRTALVGAGAIGQAFLWTITRSPVQGTLHVVEPEPVELGNLQRYVLTDMTSTSRLKTELARDHVAAHSDGNDLKVREHAVTWAEVMETCGPTWDLAAVAVDSAEARRQVQASLPNHLVNAWTQTGDLGVSTHDFFGGACCACLYLPTGKTRNEDDIVATALGVPDRLLEVRTLLYDGRPVPDELLDTITGRLGLDGSAVETFRGREIRDLYVAGICGGGLIPLSHNPAGSPVHVPLAHQSALAGVLLAARVLQVASNGETAGTEVTRVDLRRDPPDLPHQAHGKDPRGICLCQDDDYVAAYKELWHAETSTALNSDKTDVAAVTGRTSAPSMSDGRQPTTGGHPTDSEEFQWN